MRSHGAERGGQIFRIRDISRLPQHTMKEGRKVLSKEWQDPIQDEYDRKRGPRRTFSGVA